MNTEVIKLYKKIMREAEEWEPKDPGYAKMLRDHANNMLREALLGK
jgi:hypothetical protein